MSEVSDSLNSQSDIYYFNVYVDKGKGVFKLPYTNEVYQDVSVSFRKLEYLPYKTDSFSEGVKNFFRYGEIRKMGEVTNQFRILTAFLNRMMTVKGVQVLNVVSLFNYKPESESKNELLCVDYVMFSNSPLSEADNLRFVNIINDNLEERGSKYKLDSEKFNFLNLKSYPSWLSQPEADENDKKMFTGLMYSCYRLELANHGQYMNWILGNIDTSFKIRTDSVMETIISDDHSLIYVESAVLEDDCGFSEMLTQSKYRGFNYCISKSCVSSDQVIEASKNVGTKYVLDAFGVIGNLMIHFNRICMYDRDLSINLKTLTVDINLVLEGSPYIIIDLEKFKSKGSMVDAAVNFNTVQKVDSNLDLNYMRITSPIAFKSGALSQNKFDLISVLYQGKLSFQAISPYASNFVVCYRTPNTNEVPFELQLFTNNNFLFGSEVFEDTSGLLVGELVIAHSRNRIIESLF